MNTTPYTQDIRICFVGDSFTNGTEDRTHLSWTGRFCTLLQSDQVHITHYNLGIRKDTSEDIRERWQSECALRLPIHSDNRIIFCFGTNDTYIENGKLLTEKQRSIENAQHILSSAKATYPVLMIGPIPMNDTEHNNRIIDLDQSFQTLCSSLDIPYLSVCNTLINEPIWMNGVTCNPDHHATAEGYELLAQRITNWAVKIDFINHSS